MTKVLRFIDADEKKSIKQENMKEYKKINK